MTKLYGKGTITELEKGKKYRIKFSGGKDPITGKYRQIKETFLGTKRQAELRVEEIRRELESGLSMDANKVTFAAWCEQYLSTREKLGKQRPATLKRDRVLSKHLLNGLGGVLVVDITPAIINSFFASMRDNGIGETTTKQCFRLLKAILKQAVNNDLIIRNPADRAETPKTPKPNRQTLTIEQATKLASLCTQDAPTANTTAVYIALSTGARLGEILGLTWAHIVLEEEKPFIHFIQQFTSASELAPLKTDKDENPTGRVVPIDGSTARVLKAWKSEQRHYLNNLGIEQASDTPVITNTLGTFTNHSRFERWWRGFCVANGFGKLETKDGQEVVCLLVGTDTTPYKNAVIQWHDEKGIPCDKCGKHFSRSYKKPKVQTYYKGLRFHALRHTHFSLRLAQGMDTITAQYLGGWSSPAMLMNVYAHPVAQNIWNSAGFMDELTREKANK